MSVSAITDFHEKVEVYAVAHPDATVIPAYLSLGGFTADALAACDQYGIAYAEQVMWDDGK